MNPNIQAMLFSILRTVGPSALSFAVGRWPEYAGLIGEVVATITTIGSAGVGASTHTQSATMAAVEAIPDVRQIVVARGAAPEIKDIVADLARPKVVDTTTQFDPGPSPLSKKLG